MIVLLKCQIIKYRSKEKLKKVKKIVESNLSLIAHNGSGFDNYVVSDNLLQWRSVANLFNNGAGFVYLILFINYVDQKRNPHYVHFRFGGVHIDSTLKTGISYDLQHSILKQEMENDEIYEDRWETRENEWSPYVKDDVLSTAFFCARYTMSVAESTNFGTKNSLILPILSNEFFNSSRDENYEPIYTYTGPFIEKFCTTKHKKGMLFHFCLTS